MTDIPEALLNLDVDADVGGAHREPLERTSSQAMCAMMFSLCWRSGIARHTEQLAACSLNLWRDLLPFELEPELMDKPIDHVARYRYQAGELIVPYQSELCFNLSQRAFHRTLRPPLYVQPRAGRFYPRAFISGARGIHGDELLPFRIGEVSDDMIGCDLNNPLADKPLEVQARILDIWRYDVEHPGSCNDVAEMLTFNGPGMQARWRGRATDFWQDQPFARRDAEADALFYAQARKVAHVDANASAQIAGLYEELLPEDGRILDLMAGWQSHLRPQSGPAQVVGLGLNAEEMRANPALHDHRVHDLNEDPRLPFDDGEFDAVICSLSIEYLVRPFEVVADVARVLRPGGKFVATFSNRWFPPKVIGIWEQMHDFERLGLVLEYLYHGGLFDHLETWSMRGLPRPQDDVYADRIKNSDPVFAVWGTRRQDS
jgi:SAM-dependent methyltransferase